MRATKSRGARARSLWVLLATLLPAHFAGSAPPPTATGTATASPEAKDREAGPDGALKQALELERKHNWTAAIEMYEGALQSWPDRSDFRHRLRLCEIHYRIGRRYQDRSFRNVLLRLPREKAFELYEELLERIESHYVEPVAMEPMLRRGLDNLEVALRDPGFLKANAPNADPAQVTTLRDAYRARRARLATRDRAQALNEVVACCDQGRATLGLTAACVALEFVYGACDALDDYTSYLTPDKLEDLYAMIDGNFVGLGVELKQDERGLRLVGVIQGGPAAEAGLRVGDRITHVDGSPVAGLGLDEAANRLQGAERTAVRITVIHPEGASQTLSLTRRPVEVRSVNQSKIIEPATGIGYVQLTGFQKSSTEELDHAIGALQKQGLQYLILDLRGNPGGLLNVAVEMADRFLERGIIVSTRGRAPGQSSVYRAHADAPWRMPMAVLIDHDSASASEILAGALKDNHRALVIGQRSYGKGSVQSIFSLRSVPAGLKLTTAKFYSPTNRPYSEQGVEPDVAVRVAAKPVAPASGDDPAPISEPGDPTNDPVLERAIQQARRSSAPAR